MFALNLFNCLITNVLIKQNIITAILAITAAEITIDEDQEMTNIDDAEIWTEVSSDTEVEKGVEKEDDSSKGVEEFLGGNQVDSNNEFNKLKSKPTKDCG